MAVSQSDEISKIYEKKSHSGIRKQQFLRNMIFHRHLDYKPEKKKFRIFTFESFHGNRKRPLLQKFMNSFTWNLLIYFFSLAENGDNFAQFTLS